MKTRTSRSSPLATWWTRSRSTRRRTRVHAFSEPISESYVQGGQIDYDGAFAHAVTVADELGDYRLTPLSPSEMHLYALAPRPIDDGVQAFEPDEGSGFRCLALRYHLLQDFGFASR